MKETSKWWWIKSHNNTSNSSPWLNSTLSELDEKTKEMLRVIEEADDEADSFVKRAKVYYEKKPKLIAMVEDLYRSHRSLAQRHDLLIKSSQLNPYIHNSSNSYEFRSELSEVDDHGDGEEDQIVEFGNGCETMKEELERLREENRVYKEMMMREKRGEVTWLFTNSIIRICFRMLFASISVGIYFRFSFCVFVYYFLRIL